MGVLGDCDRVFRDFSVGKADWVHSERRFASQSGSFATYALTSGWLVQPNYATLGAQERSQY
jgi:hypothetical protein